MGSRYSNSLQRMQCWSLSITRPPRKAFEVLYTKGERPRYTIQKRFSISSRISFGSTTVGLYCKNNQHPFTETFHTRRKRHLFQTSEGVGLGITYEFADPVNVRHPWVGLLQSQRNYVPPICIIVCLDIENQRYRQSASHSNLYHGFKWF